MPAVRSGGISLAQATFGSAFRSGASGSFLRYPAPGNIQGESGTISMWIEPSWAPADKKFHLFFSLHGDGQLTLYKHGNSALALLLRGAKGSAGASQTILTAPLSQWKPGEAHQIAASWSAGEVRLFIDGKPVAKQDDPSLGLPAITPQSLFFLGDNYSSYGIQSDLSGEPDTLIGNVRIYDEALSDAQVAALDLPQHRAAGPPPADPPFIMVPRTRTPPKIDGQFTLAKWQGAAAFTGFLNLDNQALAERQTTVLLTYDDTRLYIALYCPLYPTEVLHADTKTKNGNVFKDDSFEIYLNPDNSRNPADVYHLIGNSIGTIYDAKNSALRANGGWIFKTQIETNWQEVGLRYWTAEASIPFSDMGRGTPKNGEKWAADFCRTFLTGEPLLTEWAMKPGGAYSLPAQFGTLEFRDDSSTFQWTELRDLSEGNPSFDFSWRGPSAAVVDLKPGEPVTLPPSGQLQRTTATIDLAGAPSGVLSIEARGGKAADAPVLYHAQLPYQIDLAPLRVFLTPLPDHDQLVVDVDPVRFRDQWKPGWSLDLALSDAQGKNWQQTSLKEFHPPMARTIFDTGSLPVGAYTVGVTLRDAQGGVRASVKDAYTKKPRPVWLGNTIGISDRVPKPWTPVETIASAGGKKSFGVWGRQYQYRGGLFPSQVIALGDPLLARPIRLVGLPDSRASLQIENSKPGCVHFDTVQKGIKVESRIEFDGMMWFEVTLPPGHIDQLALEIPLRPEAATLFHISSGDWSMVGDNAPGKTPKDWHSSWEQCAWLGNEKEGFSWFAESNQFWNLKDPSRALEITREPDATILRVNLVTQPKDYRTGAVFRFGLQATPMRPEPKGWLGWSFIRSSSINERKTPAAIRPGEGILWWNQWSPKISSPYETLPGMKALVDSYHQAGIKVIPYNALQAVNDQAPEVDDWKGEWVVTPRIPAGGEQGQTCLFVNVKGTFGDYFLYGLHELEKKGGWDGMYFDYGPGAVPDTNAYHGSGYVDENGVRHPTYDILAQREFLKRLWIMFQDDFGIEEPMIMIHLSGNKIPPIYSFCSVYFDGEQFAFNPEVDDDYTKVLSLDRFRAEFLGRQFGGVPVMMAEFRQLSDEWAKAKKADPATPMTRKYDDAIDTLLIYPYLHGTLFTPNWLDQDYLQPLFEARAKFGMADAHFVGYWENNPALHLEEESDTLKASVYVKPDKIWLVVANLGSEPQKATVTLDMKKLGATALGTGAVWTNVFGRGSLVDRSHTVQVEVPAKSLRILEFKAP